MKLAAPVTALALLTVACAGPAATSTTVAPPATTPPSTTTMAAPAAPPSTVTTSVAAPPTTVVAGAERTTLQLVDPATLRPVAPPVEVPGNVGVEQHVVLPGGRLMLLTWVGDSWKIGRIAVYEPATGAVATARSGLSSGVRLLGYSPALTHVVLMDEVGDQDPQLFDPITMRVRRAGVTLPDGEWYRHAALFDDGRKLALYAAPGFEDPGRPPFVRIADLEAGTVSDPVELEDVVHGLVEIAPEHRRDPESPYATADAGVAFDTVAGLMYVAHADSRGLTVVDLADQSTLFSRLGSRPSLWAAALRWLIPPAEAKGNEPAARTTALLSADRSRLFVTGTATDTWRDPDTNELHTTSRPLGVTVVDAESLQVDATLDLPVSWGIAATDAIVLTGIVADHTFCDEVCDPDAGVMTERGEWQHSGLYVVDPRSLEVRAHLRPDAAFYPQGAYHHWLVTESLGEDGEYVDSVDLVTGELAGRADWGTSRYMATGLGVLAVDLPG